jgi:2-amino-4-hydroxy-6-hydroxymethyldihydropteridine diphosphokinase
MGDKRISRPHRVFLSIGSNLEPERNLAAAVRELGGYGRILRVSRVWQSPPLGNPLYPDYLNAAILLETSLSARELKETAIATIETGLGRVRGVERDAPRTIDIDIMLFDREQLRIGRRSIPDLEVRERPFVAIPLAEIAPDYVHPVTGETLAEIAVRFDPRAWGMRLRLDVILSPEASKFTRVNNS